MPQKKDEKSYLFRQFGKLLTIPPKTVCALLSALCRCTACVTVAHRWCSVHPSSPGGSHTCPPGRCRGRCSVGDSPSAHILVLSSLPRSDTHRWCISHGYHSPPHTPLLRRRKKKKPQRHEASVLREAPFYSSVPLLLCVLYRAFNFHFIQRRYNVLHTKRIEIQK